jgi:hypothetical protein
MAAERIRTAASGFIQRSSKKDDGNIIAGCGCLLK